MGKCSFYDPNLDSTYTWHVNHESQVGPNLNRNVTYEGLANPTYGVIGSEGSASPVLIQLRGTIIHSAQYKKFYEYYALKYSFRFTDEEGAQYEVTMTSLEMEKVRVFWNPADPLMRLHKWTWSMELRVLTVLSGDLLGRVQV